jgi:hypothetical protein
MEALFAANEKNDTKIKFIENIDKSLSNGITNDSISSHIGTFPGEHSEYRSTFDTTGIGPNGINRPQQQQQQQGGNILLWLTYCL